MGTEGKMIQKEPEESMQTQAQFTNFTHQEFSDDKPPPEDIIPRMDSSPSSEKPENGSQRIVPIQIVETGETLMPTFTKLEDPQPPPWSTFSKLNKAQEREVPLKMEEASEEASEAKEKDPWSTSSKVNKDQAKEVPLKMEGEASEAKERGRAASQKTKVRFDLNDSSSIKSERRSSSVETYTRKTTVTSSKPPTDKQQPRRPVVKANETAGPTAKWRTASAERPATMSPNTERTLQEIDRDINQIWRELQELEKLPNGGYRPRSTPPYATATPITPVKVKASYVAKPMTVTPTTQRRTIWDYEQENNNKIEANASPISRPPRSQLPPPPPLPPHLRPSQPPKSVTIVAPIARDESCYDIGSTSPSVTSAYDNDLAETPNVNFKGFPYIDGAPSRKKPQKMEVTEAAKASNNFSLLVDKSTQTPEEKLQRKAKEACAIL